MFENATKSDIAARNTTPKQFSAQLIGALLSSDSGAVKVSYEAVRTTYPAWSGMDDEKLSQAVRRALKGSDVKVRNRADSPGLVFVAAESIS